MSHPSNADVCELLVMAGAPQVACPWPDELAERRGPRFKMHDLLDFHVLLRDDAWSGRLAALVDGADRSG